MFGILRQSGGMMRREIAVAMIALAIGGGSRIATAQGTTLGAGSGREQGSDSVRRRVGRGSATLDGISLTDAQKASVRTINQKYAGQLKELRQANAGDSLRQKNPQVRAKMQRIAGQERAEVRGVLTADQRTQFDANVKKMLGRGKHRHAFKQMKKPIRP
jgi:Spy/CpxP family protein refolding chaperone